VLEEVAAVRKVAHQPLKVEVAEEEVLWLVAHLMRLHCPID